MPLAAWWVGRLGRTTANAADPCGGLTGVGDQRLRDGVVALRHGDLIPEADALLSSSHDDVVAYRSNQVAMQPVDRRHPSGRDLDGTYAVTVAVSDRDGRV